MTYEFNANKFLLLHFSDDGNGADGSRSPVIGNRNEIQSPGSKTPNSGQLSPTSTDPWPAQSDEDIDRLVAMHRNRASLGSLGVSFSFHFSFIS